jgi:ribosomal protein S18 acetylase RimI-like enzyme
LLVRSARLEDAAAIAEVHVRTWQAAYEHVFGAERLATLDHEQRRAQWESRLAAQAREAGYSSYVAEDEGGHVVGFATAGASRDVGDEGELYAIYVLPEAWGSGAGRELMSAVLESLRSSGFAGAALWVLEDNPRARRFYERDGWTPDGERREQEALGIPFVEVRYRITLD